MFAYICRYLYEIVRYLLFLKNKRAATRTFSVRIAALGSYRYALATTLYIFVASISRITSPSLFLVISTFLPLRRVISIAAIASSFSFTAFFTFSCVFNSFPFLSQMYKIDTEPFSTSIIPHLGKYVKQFSQLHKNKLFITGLLTRC